jgi:hypothetical protein
MDAAAAVLTAADGVSGEAHEKGDPAAKGG